MDGNDELFAKDKDTSAHTSGSSKEEGYKKLIERVACVDSLENTLSYMMKQIADLREEIKGVHEENKYLIPKADRTMKDVLMEQLAKAETKVQELHERLVSVKDSIKQMAKDTVGKMKQLGDKALFTVVELTHFGELLSLMASGRRQRKHFWESVIYMTG